MAAFSTEGEALQAITIMLMGQVAKKAEKALAAARTTERKKPGPKKGWKAKQETVVEPPVQEAA